MNCIPKIMSYLSSQSKIRIKHILRREHKNSLIKVLPTLSRKFPAPTPSRSGRNTTQQQKWMAAKTKTPRQQRRLMRQVGSNMLPLQRSQPVCSKRNMKRKSEGKCSAGMRIWTVCLQKREILLPLRREILVVILCLGVIRFLLLAVGGELLLRKYHICE